MAPNFIKEFTAGQKKIIDNIQLLTLTENENLFSKMDYENRDNFLNPFAFSYFHQQNWLLDKTNPRLKDPRITLEQIYFCALNKSKLPKDFVFKVYADDHGCVYLPAIGQFNIDKTDIHLDICYTKEHNTFELFSDTEKLLYTFTKSSFIPGSSVEIYSNTNPFFNNVFESAFEDFNIGRSLDEAYNLCNTPITPLSGINNEKIFEAFRIVSESNLKYSSLLQNSIKGIFNFSNDVIWSFAHKGAYGISFISGTDKDSIIFFVAEMAHQGGHTAFAAILTDLERHFVIDPATPMNQISDNSADLRSVENALHGLYTTSKVAEILDYLYKNQNRLELTADEKHEIVGRLADDFYRHKTGLHTTDLYRIFTKKGLSIYNALDNYLTKLFSKYNSITTKYRYAKGDFVFSYDKFKQAFPLS